MLCVFVAEEGHPNDEGDFRIRDHVVGSDFGTTGWCGAYLLATD